MQVSPSGNLGRDFVLPGPRCRKKEKITGTPGYQNIDSSPIYFEFARAVWGLAVHVVGAVAAAAAATYAQTANREYRYYFIILQIRYHSV